MVFGIDLATGSEIKFMPLPLQQSVDTPSPIISLSAKALF
jgi:hypothetical protein